MPMHFTDERGRLKRPKPSADQLELVAAVRAGKGYLDAKAEQRQRREPQAPNPIRPGWCDWCGRRTKQGQNGYVRSYCGPACRVAYNNLLTTQGKPLVQLLKIWRKTRGRKGTRGAGILGMIASRVDELNTQDQERKDQLNGQ